MSSIEKLKTERNQVREILSMLTSDFQDEFSDKDFEHMNRVLDLINTDEKLIDDLFKENLENESEARELNIRFTEFSKQYVELVEKMNRGLEHIKLLLWDLRNRDWDCTKDMKKAEEFLDEFNKRTN